MGYLNPMMFSKDWHFGQDYFSRVFWYGPNVSVDIFINENCKDRITYIRELKMKSAGNKKVALFSLYL